MSSSGSDYVPKEHEDFDQYGSFAKTLQDNALLQLCCKFGVPKWNLYWVFVLTNSSGTNYVLNEYEHFDQYGPYAIPSEIMPCYSHPAGLTQYEIPINLSC